MTYRIFFFITLAEMDFHINVVSFCSLECDRVGPLRSKVDSEIVGLATVGSHLVHIDQDRAARSETLPRGSPGPMSGAKPGQRSLEWVSGGRVSHGDWPGTTQISNMALPPPPSRTAGIGCAAIWVAEVVTGLSNPDLGGRGQLWGHGMSPGGEGAGVGGWVLPVGSGGAYLHAQHWIWIQNSWIGAGCHFSLDLPKVRVRMVIWTVLSLLAEWQALHLFFVLFVLFAKMIKEASVEAADLLRDFKNKPEILSSIKVFHLSKSTVTQHCEVMAEDLTQQLQRVIADCECFSLQLEKSTDTSDTAQMCIITRMAFTDMTAKEELLIITAHKRRGEG